MSWFTADKGTLSPTCPRCGKPGFARLVKNSGAFTVWDCTRCGPVDHTKKASKK